MSKIIDIILFSLTIFFIFIIYKYYSSHKDNDIKIYDRSNVEQILKEKNIHLPILSNDTDNVIEFNNSLEDQLNDKKKRSFWELLKNNMKRKALNISIKSFKLSKKEMLLLSRMKPWGIILFKRNIKSIHQIKYLTNQIKKLTKNKNFPILIDEEGKNVSRLRQIINHDISANFFGNLYKNEKVFCLNLLRHYIGSLSKVLNSLGININTVPVLDVLRKNTNKVIGNRSFSKNKSIVRELGKATVKYFHLNKIGCIIKHIPDTVHVLQIVTKKCQEYFYLTKN